LFQRVVTLYEELSDYRGDKYHRPLGGASWFQTPDRTGQRLVLGLDASPTSDTLTLETHNGDNPPIELEKFQAFYSATRVLFKAQAADELLLYYGNPQTAAPRYDLSLVAGQLLAADQAEAALAAEEQLKNSWGAGHRPGQGGVVFWGILAVVVVVLLHHHLPTPAPILADRREPLRLNPRGLSRRTTMNQTLFPSRFPPMMVIASPGGLMVRSTS
jgi:hypothetical protein